MERISKISVSGFKSIRDCRDLELRPLNVLVGANGSGKSNLLSFLRLLRNLQIGALQESIVRAGGAQTLLHFGARSTPQIEFAVEVSSAETAHQYSATLAFAVADRLIFARETICSTSPQGTGVQDILDPNLGHLETSLNSAARAGSEGSAAVSRALRRIRHFHFSDTSVDTPARSRASHTTAQTHLLPDASNLPVLLMNLRAHFPDRYNRVVELIRIVAPYFRDFVLDPEQDNGSTLLQWRADGDAEYQFGPHQLSDGTLRFMAVIAFLLQPVTQGPGLLLLDEPELGLHPTALHVLSGLLAELSENTQIVVATQSTPFIDGFNPGDVIVCGLNQGGTTFERLEEEPLAEWLREYSLGDLMRKNVISTGPAYA